MSLATVAATSLTLAAKQCAEATMLAAQSAHASAYAAKCPQAAKALRAAQAASQAAVTLLSLQMESEGNQPDAKSGKSSRHRPRSSRMRAAVTPSTASPASITSSSGPSSPEPRSDVTNDTESSAVDHRVEISLATAVLDGVPDVKCALVERFDISSDVGDTDMLAGHGQSQQEQFADEEEEEELVDVPASVKQADPLYGSVVEVILHGCKHKGTVEDIEMGANSKVLLYRVRYEDSDLEHMTALQVQNCLVHV